MQDNYFGCILNEDRLDAFKSNDKKLFLISGASRGGTSIVAYALRKSGIEFGPVDPNNHEPAELIRDPSNRGVMERFIKNISSVNLVSAVKFPDFSFHMDSVSKIHGNTLVLYIVRNPISISKTIVNREEKFNKNPKGVALGLQHASRYYTAFADSLSSLACPVVLLDFDRVKENSFGFVDFLSDIGVSFSDEVREVVARQIAAPGYKPIIS